MAFPWRGKLSCSVSREKMSETEALRKMRICVLMGGTSSEREISLQSGEAVAEVLRQEGFSPVALDVEAEGERRLTRKLKEAGAGIVVLALHGPWGED